MKAGIKTTEFWATLIGSITVAGASELELNLNEASVASIAAMMPLWLSALIAAIREFSQTFLAYTLGQERLKREQAEET